MQNIYAIGSGGIQKSSDGTTWSSVSTTSNTASIELKTATGLNILFKNDYDNSIRKLYKSTDLGVTWSQVIFTDMVAVNDIKYNNSYFLACGNNSSNNIIVAKSTDGNIWTEYIISGGSVPSYTIGTGGVLFWNGTKWMMRIEIGTSDRYNKYSAISTDGVTWNTFSFIVNTYTYLEPIGDINYFNGKWTSVFGYSFSGTYVTGYLYTSSNDGLSWSNQELGGTAIVRSYYYNNKIIFLANGYQFIHSNDLISFTTIVTSTNPVFNNLTLIFKDVKYFNNKFIFFGTDINSNQTFIYTTTDFITFTLVPNTNFFSNSRSLEIVYEIPCLLKGMKIKMKNGTEKKVEDINIDDSVDLFGRSIPIKKIFSTTVIGDHKNIPFIIPKDFFEKEIPIEDIYLSYNHAFFYNGWKLPIHTDELKQDKSYLGKELTYYHFELPNYSEDKMVCQGLPVDSYKNEML